MSIDFAALDARLSAAVDDRLGDTVTFTPARKVDNVGNPVGVDTRAPATVVGLLVEGDTDLPYCDGARGKSDFSTRAVRIDAWASFDRDRFPASGLPRKGDLISVDAPSPKTFEIIAVLDDGAARLACLLVRK